MNKEAQAHLDELLAKTLADLTPSDIAFLQARRDYLTPEQREAFGIDYVARHSFRDKYRSTSRAAGFETSQTHPQERILNPFILNRLTQILGRRR